MDVDIFIDMTEGFSVTDKTQAQYTFGFHFWAMHINIAFLAHPSKNILSTQPFFYVLQFSS